MPGVSLRNVNATTRYTGTSWYRKIFCANGATGFSYIYLRVLTCAPGPFPPCMLIGLPYRLTCFLGQGSFRSTTDERITKLQQTAHKIHYLIQTPICPAYKVTSERNIRPTWKDFLANGRNFLKVTNKKYMTSFFSKYFKWIFYFDVNYVQMHVQRFFVVALPPTVLELWTKNVWCLKYLYSCFWISAQCICHMRLIFVSLMWPENHYSPLLFIATSKLSYEKYLLVCSFPKRRFWLYICTKAQVNQTFIQQNHVVAIAWFKCLMRWTMYFASSIIVFGFKNTDAKIGRFVLYSLIAM